jgi:lysine-N-methylase
MLSVCPDYALKFKCLADRCKDSCCVGWEIGIDVETLADYKGLDGELGRRIRQNIDERDGGAVFKLSEDGRCPFLDRCGLCDIIKERGEGGIPEICREHPRYYNVLSDRTEWGVGLSCEEAARLILECEDVRGGDTAPSCDECENFLLFARGEAYKVLYESAFSVGERLAALIYYAEAVDAALESEEYAEIYPAMPLNLDEKLDTGWGVGDFSAILRFFLDMDFMDLNFKKRIEAAVKDEVALPRLNEKNGAFVLRLVAYFLHRYFITAAWDSVTVSKVKFAVVSALVILCLCGEDADKKDFIDTAKAYSKEMEYNEDNRELFFDGCFTESVLSSANIILVLT